MIASGPLTPDETTFDDALVVLDSYSLDVPMPVRRHLRRGSEGKHPETPTAEDPVFADVSIHILADNRTALEPARDCGRERGYEPMILSSGIRGDAREVAKVHVGIAEDIRSTGESMSPPAVLHSGGETTVTVRGDGAGGPNQEFALSAALELAEPELVIGAVDTDGIDGNMEVAGGLVDSRTIESVDRANAARALEENDTATALEEADATVLTAQTRTNVNDIRVIVVPE